jgi:hypothetical protein
VAPAADAIAKAEHTGEYKRRSSAAKVVDRRACGIQPAHPATARAPKTSATAALPARVVRGIDRGTPATQHAASAKHFAMTRHATIPGTSENPPIASASAARSRAGHALPNPHAMWRMLSALNEMHATARSSANSDLRIRGSFDGEHPLPPSDDAPRRPLRWRNSLGALTQAA